MVKINVKKVKWHKYLGTDGVLHRADRGGQKHKQSEVRDLVVMRFTPVIIGRV
jgi:hypothetical protein